MESIQYKECTPVGEAQNGNLSYSLNYSMSHLHGNSTLRMRNLGGTTEDATQHFEYVEWILYARVTVAIAVLGILGNILNLIILTRRKLTSSMDRMEK